MQLRVLLPGLSFLVAGLALGTPAAQAAQSAPGISRQDPSDLEYVQQKHRQSPNRQNSRSQSSDNNETARLNEESLRRAQQGQNALSNQPDTTSNLNRMSDRDAEGGVNTGSQPLIPFR